jgi:hypothetical protein
MKWNIRLIGQLADQIRADLRRPHAFAAERVGFLRCRVATLDQAGWLILPFDYLPIPDERYIRDDTVGAKIDSSAIRIAMDAAMADDIAILHVHLHEHAGQPGFSRTDLNSYPGLVRALQNAAPSRPHGAIVLSDDSANALIWLPGSSRPERGGKIVVVGRPMRFLTEGGLYA